MKHQKNLNQWFLKISDYSDELLDGLNEIGDWPENVKAMQQNWIGRSEGAEFSLKIDGTKEKVNNCKGIILSTLKNDTFRCP